MNLPTDVELEASAEMIAFMWVSTGIDPAQVTPQLLATIQTLLAQNWAQLPADLQPLFANGQANYAALQTTWNGAAPMEKLAMVQQFAQFLTALGVGGGSPESNKDPSSNSDSTTLGDLASNIVWNTSGAGDWSAR